MKVWKPHMYSYKNTIRRPVRLNLGSEYTIRFGHGNSVVGRLIMPTKCGFNFLNETTNKCIMKNHLYKSKRENHLSEDWFFINTYFTINEVNKSNVA